MHIDSDLLVYVGTVVLGVLMLGVSVLSFLAVASVLAVLYGLVHAVRRLAAGAVRLAAAAARSRPVVVPGPVVLRHSSRPVVVLAPRKPTKPPLPRGTGGFVSVDRPVQASRQS